jgi:hypothetical protein
MGIHLGAGASIAVHLNVKMGMLEDPGLQKPFCPTPPVELLYGLQFGS